MFPPSTYTEIPHVDLLSWTFGNLGYDLEKPILVDAHNKTSSFSYHEAKSIVRKLIAGLQARGLCVGETVCLHSFNTINYTLMYLAIIGAGGRFLGSNPAHTTPELNHLFELCKVRFVIVENDLLERIVPSAHHANILLSNIFIFDIHGQTSPRPSWDALLQYGEKDWIKFDDEVRCKTTTAALMSTSGTTGIPKAAEISHYALIAQTVMFHDSKQKPYEIKRLICLPQFHSFNSSMAVLAPLREGHTTYMMRRYNFHQLLDFIDRYGITETTMVNPILLDLLASPEKASRCLDSLRFIWCGGVPLSASLQNRFSSILHPEAIVSQVYGMTENAGWITCMSYPEKDVTGVAGRLLPNITARIVDDNFNDHNNEGVAGQLLIKSPSLMTGYVENAKATESSMMDGWLLTGDIAYQKDGKWYIIDRAKELIKVRGWQVSPVEIEACLLTHPDVADVAVIGVDLPDELGEVPRAYVVVGAHSNHVTDSAISSHLNGRLSNYKALAGGIRTVQSIPRNSSGKILKKVLREMARTEMAQDRCKKGLTVT